MCFKSYARTFLTYLGALLHQVLVDFEVVKLLRFDLILSVPAREDRRVRQYDEEHKVKLEKILDNSHSQCVCDFELPCFIKPY